MELRSKNSKNFYFLRHSNIAYLSISCSLHFLQHLKSMPDSCCRTATHQSHSHHWFTHSGKPLNACASICAEKYPYRLKCLYRLNYVTWNIATEPLLRLYRASSIQKDFIDTLMYHVEEINIEYKSQHPFNTISASFIFFFLETVPWVVRVAPLHILHSHYT